MAEPPYGVIDSLLRNGQVVPFLGAGVNFGRRPTGYVWDRNSNEFLPSGPELARRLSKMSSFPSRLEHDLDDLAKVASYFVEASARRTLRQELSGIFDKDYSPCSVHEYLAELPVPLLIVTTNYDDLTEKAFKQNKKTYDLVIHPTDRKDMDASVLWWPHGASEPKPITPNRLDIDLSKTTVIYKMHGTVDRELKDWHSFVITEEDYVDFLSRMIGQTAVPAQFSRHFRDRHFLFLGYGLRDWNLRVILKNIRARSRRDPEASASAFTDTNGALDIEEEERLRSWAIQSKPSELETALWLRRDVTIYDMDINVFVDKLRKSNL